MSEKRIITFEDLDRLTDLPYEHTNSGLRNFMASLPLAPDLEAIKAEINARIRTLESHKSWQRKELVAWYDALSLLEKVKE